jgi:hypothetical protein
MRQKIVASKVDQEAPQGYEEFKALIEAYKIQNPVKYEAKKEALEAKLETLKQ